jgi:CRISPR-associated protein Cmr3
VTALFLEPLDVWMFRDGRPFDAGQAHRAESRFPPFPLTVQGALRAYHLAVVRKDVPFDDAAAIEAAVGPADGWGPLRMCGPFVARRAPNGHVERLFPPPSDAVPAGNGTIARLPAPVSPPAWLWANTPVPQLFPLWESEREGRSSKGEPRLWLTLAELERYLAREAVAGTPEDQIWEREVRVGIAQDSSRRVTMEAQYYEAAYVRLRAGYGLLVEFAGLDGWPERGLLALGGERRSASFEAVRVDALPAAPDPLPERFSVYLATPAWFDEGWRPRDWGALFEGQVELVTAAVPRYEVGGGFSLAGNQQRPSRRFVPAGSVYSFRARPGARLRRVEGCWWPNFTQWGAEIGFGVAVIGGW